VYGCIKLEYCNNVYSNCILNITIQVLYLYLLWVEGYRKG